MTHDLLFFEPRFKEKLKAETVYKPALRISQLIRYQMKVANDEIFLKFSIYFRKDFNSF